MGEPSKGRRVEISKEVLLPGIDMINIMGTGQGAQVAVRNRIAAISDNWKKLVRSLANQKISSKRKVDIRCTCNHMGIIQCQFIQGV